MEKYTGTLAFTYFMMGVKVALALLMLLGGISTALSPVSPAGGALGALFSNRIMLVLFGLTFFLSGLAVLYGTFRKRKKLVGTGLATIYLLSLFTFFLELFVFGASSTWIDNLIIAIISGLSWLWWKFKTEYLNLDEIRRIRQSLLEEDRHP